MCASTNMGKYVLTLHTACVALCVVSHVRDSDCDQRREEDPSVDNVDLFRRA
jgi:hypothetical protein